MQEKILNLTKGYFQAALDKLGLGWTLAIVGGFFSLIGAFVLGSALFISQEMANRWGFHPEDHGRIKVLEEQHNQLAGRLITIGKSANSADYNTVKTRVLIEALKDTVIGRFSSLNIKISNYEGAYSAKADEYKEFKKEVRDGFKELRHNNR